MPLILDTVEAIWAPSFATGIARAATLGLAAVAVCVVTVCAYRLFWHPLAGVPGPWLAVCSSEWLAWHTYIGDECTAIWHLHEKYGPVLRVGPNEIDISDVEAVAPIYVDRGGFRKTPNYAKFDVDSHSTLFSTRAREDRLSRARAVAPLFSTASIRTACTHTNCQAADDANGSVARVVDRFVQRIQAEASRSRRTGASVNVLNLARSMALDAVSSYLFQEPYGALTEDDADTVAGVEAKPSSPSSSSSPSRSLSAHDVTMSASPFVDAFVGVGAFFNVALWWPSWDVLLMGWIDRFTGTMTTDHTEASMAKIDAYTERLVNGAVPGSGSYVSRLLAVGDKEHMPRDLWRKQVQAECKDVCFAGTDSSGMNLAMLLWQLARHRDVYQQLRRAVADAREAGTDPTAHPYVRAVVRESLRLAWANPIRLPRVVPDEGWAYHGHSFPPGTSVGVAAFQLHQEPSVFPEPAAFRPERWLAPSDQMLNHFFAFGKGGRACIGQNLGMAELHTAAVAIAAADALDGAEVVQEKIEILEWFNSRVKGEQVLLRFT